MSGIWQAKSMIGGVSLVILLACPPKQPKVTPTPTPTPIPPPVAATGCYDATPAPSLRTGSLDLVPIVTTFLPGPAGPNPKRIYINVPSSPLTLSEDIPGTTPHEVFEICVKTNPPAGNNPLGSGVVQGTLLNPQGSDDWKRIFGALFLGPLQATKTNGAGVLKIDVSASAIYNALQTAPTNDGTMHFVFQLNPTYEMDITLVKP